MEIQNESNQKIHHKDGAMVEDLVRLVDDDAPANSDEESDEDDPADDEDQSSSSGSNDSESDDDKDVEPTRAVRFRKPPERLNPTMTGQSYATKKINIKMKRKMKKDIKLRTKKKFREEHYNLYTQGIRTENDCMEYTNLEGMILAMFMVRFNEMTDVENYKSFSQQYQLGKGLKLFGERGHKASASELEQLHHRKCFHPVSVNNMTRNERMKAQMAMMLLTEKRCGKVKGRMVFDGRKTREWITKEDSASPTAILEGILLTLTIDAHEKRDVMSADVPNAFIQTEMPEIKQGEERVMMNIA